MFTSLSGISPQHSLITLANTLSVFYIALTTFLVYLFVAQLCALYRSYAPAAPVTTLVQLETAWTLVPIAFIAVCALCTASFMQFADTSSSFTPFTHILHVEGAQWYWRVNGDDLRLLTIPVVDTADYFGLPRLALTSSLASVPINQATLFTVTSPDVIHSLSIPALSVKLDCIPGRLSQCSPHLSVEGTYIGYCAELCGLGHSAMPINLVVYTPVSLYGLCVLSWFVVLLVMLYGCVLCPVSIHAVRLTALFHRVSRDYAVPLHLSPWHSLGFFVGIAIGMQLVSGFVLACQYVPGFVGGYTAVRQLVNDTAFGYLVQALHANGAAVVMAALFLHMLRTLWYGHTTPRISLYGFILLILLVAVCFTGYTLAACQMSYWAAAVIFRMLSVIPFVGDRLADYILAGPAPWDMTLCRIFTVHVILPFVVLAFIIVHVLELHSAGSAGDFSTRLDVHRVDESDFHRLVWARDTLALLLYCAVTYVLVFVFPELLLHPDTWVPANPLVTPLSIQPEWYFMLLYSILRAVPHKGVGMLVLVLFILSFYSIYSYFRVNEHRSRTISLRAALLLSLVDFLCISYLCTHLHHYDTFFSLMLYLAICTHLFFIGYHSGVVMPSVQPTRYMGNFTHLTLHVQSQEGPKLPSYWVLAIIMWFSTVCYVMLSLSTRVASLGPLLVVVLAWLVLLAACSAAYDSGTWSRESTRNTLFFWYCIILFESLLFASVIAAVLATQLDVSVARVVVASPVLYELLPPTAIALYLLLFVTWYLHAVINRSYVVLLA